MISLLAVVAGFAGLATVVGAGPELSRAAAYAGPTGRTVAFLPVGGKFPIDQPPLPTATNGPGASPTSPPAPTPTAAPLSSPTANATATTVPVSNPTATSTPATADWLNRLNALRAMASLPPVTENATWSDGGYKHSRYMVKNSYIGHDEQTGNTWYTPEGRSAAQSGNVAVSSGATYPDTRFVDLWAVGPFHMLGLIDPALRTSGFGSYREAGAATYRSGATLDVIRGLGTVPSGVAYPILWPGNGKSVDLTSYGGSEFPDPLTSCSGFTAPTGLPIVVQTGRSVTPVVTASSFRQGGTELPHCVFTGGTYVNTDAPSQSLARSILNMRGALILIPRSPLQPGTTYAVAVTVNGNPVAWTFSTTLGALSIGDGDQVLIH